MYTKNDPIRKLIEKNGVLIAAHRGTCGGNVVQNTSLSYKNALLHGADMIEVDAAMTTDGVFYAFHNGEEKIEYGIQKDIRTMSSTGGRFPVCLKQSGTEDEAEGRTP